MQSFTLENSFKNAESDMLSKVSKTFLSARFCEIRYQLQLVFEGEKMVHHSIATETYPIRVEEGKADDVIRFKPLLAKSKAMQLGIHSWF